MENSVELSIVRERKNNSGTLLLASLSCEIL